MLVAAASWDALAAELASAAENYGSVIARLTGMHWWGPASTSMLAMSAPYVEWLERTAAQTKQTATQARAAAAAFEQAHAMTVPPALVTANRAELKALIASNLLGQNTAAIAAIEAQYAEMWAQDAAAMYGYATTSAAARQLTPFSSPQQTTNPAGLAAQNAAVTQAWIPSPIASAKRSCHHTARHGSANPRHTPQLRPGHDTGPRHASGRTTRVQLPRAAI